VYEDEEIRQMFKEYDADGSETLNAEEFRELMASTGGYT
jgi:Ca2+-binding EF-hand superfamily protein